MICTSFSSFILRSKKKNKLFDDIIVGLISLPRLLPLSHTLHSSHMHTLSLQTFFSESRFIFSQSSGFDESQKYFTLELCLAE